jgi:hypothetical protein
MKIKILESALHDLMRGYRFYDGQNAGLGEYFLDSLYSDIDSLLLSAGMHGIHFGKHRLLSKRFPFAVYYSLNNESVIVYAVLDCRHDPLKLKTRIE